MTQVSLFLHLDALNLDCKTLWPKTPHSFAIRHEEIKFVLCTGWKFLLNFLDSIEMESCMQAAWRKTSSIGFHSHGSCDQQQ